LGPNYCLANNRLENPENLHPDELGELPWAPNT